jgi:hypothetical protein
LPEINISNKNNFGSVVYWFLAIVCFALGLYLSKIDWLLTEWFSRSGCLVVVLGVWSSIGVVFHEKLISRRANWIRNKELRQLKAKALEDSEIALGIDQVNADHDQRLSLAIQNLRMSIGVLEMSLLISGTLVWGFGDLIVQAILL